MKRMIQFAKIEATGNDFICIQQDEKEPFSAEHEVIERMCNRHIGIGADGLILLQPSEEEIPHMRYFNSDGYESTMCGNGLRAAALFAEVIGKRCQTPTVMKAGDGIHRVHYHSAARISVEIFSAQKQEQIDGAKLELPPQFNVLGKVNTGVPHLVIDVGEALKELDVQGIGRRLRNHLMFAPEGSNINFIKSLTEEMLEVRTYERGVEEETMSCGTGVTASALLFRQHNTKMPAEIRVMTRGGRLIVRFEQDKIFLEGPAHVVFYGHYFI